MTVELPTTARLSYAQRAELCSHPVSRILFQLIQSKESNLCVSADVTSKAALIEIADAVGPYCCVLKTHIDIIEDFDQDLIAQLQKLSQKHQFLIFEDRKFADIGSTVKRQYAAGPFKIADWAHIVNAHAIPGPGIIEGLREVGMPYNRGLLLLAEMSSRGNLAQGAYTQATIKLARDYPEFVMGFISQHRICDNPTSVHFVPGVRFESGLEALGQQWNTPETVITERGADVIIVGRGICEAASPEESAERYRVAGWTAYQSCVQSQYCFS